MELCLYDYRGGTYESVEQINLEPGLIILIAVKHRQGLVICRVSAVAVAKLHGEFESTKSTFASTFAAAIRQSLHYVYKVYKYKVYKV